MRLMTFVSGLVLATGLVLLQPTAASAKVAGVVETGPITVSIEGAVVTPGTFDLKPGWGLGDLILAAGKMTVLADTERLELRRKGEAPRRIELSKLFAAGEAKLELAPGDHIVVPEHRDRVLLLGVPGGGYRPVVPGQKVSDFFRIAENAMVLDTTKVDLSKTQLVRKGQPAVTINLKEIRRNPRGKQNVQLASGDVIWLEGRVAPGASLLLTGFWLCGVSAAHNSEKLVAATHAGHGGKAKMGCCIPAPCHEVGNRGFFTKTKHAGYCATSNCDANGGCAGHGKHEGHSHL